MSNFVYDQTSLNFPKTNLNAPPAGADLSKYVIDTDWNTISQAVVDVRSVLLGAKWYGLFSNTVDPAPSGITSYLWLNSGALTLHTGAANHALVTDARQVLSGTGLSGGGALSGDVTLSLANTAVTPGSYTLASITVDAMGRITAASSGSLGTDTDYYQTIKNSAGTALTQQPTLKLSAAFSPTNDGTNFWTLVDLSTTGVTAGSYTNATLTVDANGRLTAASSGTAPATFSGLVNTQLVFANGTSSLTSSSSLTWDGTQLLVNNLDAHASAALALGGTNATSVAVGKVGSAVGYALFDTTGIYLAGEGNAPVNDTSTSWIQIQNRTNGGEIAINAADTGAGIGIISGGPIIIGNASNISINGSTGLLTLNNATAINNSAAALTISAAGLTLTTPTSTSTSAITVKTGDGTGTNASSGSLTLDVGVKTGTGTTGTVGLANTSASALTLAHGSIPVTANGAWTFGSAVTFNGSPTITGSTTSGVGIRLDVSNTSTTTGSFGALSCKGNNGAVQIEMYADGIGNGPLATAGGFLGMVTSHPVGIFTNNLERMRVLAGGNVGINTTAPSEIFVVGGNTSKPVVGNNNAHTLLYSTFDSQTNTALEINNTSTSGNGGPNLVLSQNNTAVGCVLGNLAFACPGTAGSEKRGALISSAVSGSGAGTTVTGNMLFYTANAGTLSERMRITETGAVGIGTSPSFPLHVVSVSGGAVVARIEDTAGICNFDIASASGGVNLSSTLRFLDGGSVKGQISATADGKFWLYSNASGTPAIAIDATSRVGMGTSSQSPDQVLSVTSGNASKLSGGSWASYISDARLKTIQSAYTKGLAEIMQLNPSLWNYKAGNPAPYDIDPTVTYYGFTAQDVEAVFPEATRTKDDGYKTIEAFEPIYWAMLNGIKELAARMTAAEAKLPA